MTMKHYDLDGDGCLSVKDELAKAILPRDKNYRDLCINRKVFAGAEIRHHFYSRA